MKKAIVIATVKEWNINNYFELKKELENEYSLYLLTNKDELSFENIEKIKRVEIYNVNGILVQVIEKPFNNKNYITLKNPTKGMYLLKFDNNSFKFLVE